MYTTFELWGLGRTISAGGKADPEHASEYVCTYVCMYACMYVRMYVCMYVNVSTYALQEAS